MSWVLVPIIQAMLRKYIFVLSTRQLVPGNQHPKTRPSWANALGSRGSISQLLLGPHAPIFWRFLRHIRTLLDYLGGVETHVGRVPVPKNWDKLSKYIGEWRSISQLLLGPHAPNTFLEVPETHRSISRSLGRCWHTCWQSASPQNWAKLSKNISFYEVQCTKYFLEVLETHRNISRLLDRCWHTCRQSVCAQKQGQVEQIHGEWGGQYFSFY